MTASTNIPTMTEDNTSVSLIGNPCGEHGQYTFYKAFKYQRSSDQTKRVLMLGEFFFLRISPHDDPCIGELQLLWEDRQRNQLLSSTRLYFLPEQTPDGRQSHHGEHEVVAASEKVVLRLTDLVSWITHQVDWIAGLHYHWKCATRNGKPTAHTRKGCPLSPRAFIHNQNMNLPSRNAFLTSQRIISDRCKILDTISDSPPSPCPPRGLDFNDVIEEKLKANELQTDLSTVVILSYARYCRYRTLLRRVDGSKIDLLLRPIVQDALVELGIPLERNNRVNILFCRDSFDHEALVNNDLNCDHLAPRLKGRPRKRNTKQDNSRHARASSPDSSSEESTKITQPRRSRRSIATSSLVSYVNYSETRATPRRNRQKRNLKRTKINNNATLKKTLNNRKSNKAKLEGNSSSGNDTDSSSSSVDANNNLTADISTVNNLNRELKEKVQNESIFLEELTKFMKERKTPIHRVPNLGFKKIDLHVFYTHAQKFGGYDILTKERLWKKLYDVMGGDKRSTSAATCTRRHYERLLLPFERFLDGFPNNLSAAKNKSINNVIDASKDVKEEDAEDDEANNEDVEELNIASDDEKVLQLKEDDAKSSLVNSKLDDVTRVDSGRISNLDNDHERLILKFSRVKKAPRPTKSKLTKSMNFDLTNTDSTFAFKDDSELLNSNTAKNCNRKRDSFKFNQDEDVKINVDNLESEHPKSEQDSKFIDRIELRQKQNEYSSFSKRNSLLNSTSPATSVSSGNNITGKNERLNSSSGFFSHSNSHNKMTALVHPTQRESKPADIYDFKDNIMDNIDNQKETMNKILKSGIDEKAGLSSPLHSISSLVSQMPETIPQKRSKVADPQSLNKSVIKAIISDDKIQNSFVRKAFPLPKPLDSPNEILLTLKKSDHLKHKIDSLMPQPAHKAFHASIQNNEKHNTDKHKNNQLPSKTVQIPKIEILDLSVKRRSFEVDSDRLSPSTSNLEENILDLSVNRTKLASKDSICINNELSLKKGSTSVSPSWKPFNSNPNISRIDRLGHSKPKMTDFKKNNGSQELAQRMNTNKVDEIRIRSTTAPAQDNTRNRSIVSDSVPNAFLNGKRKGPTNSRESKVNSRDSPLLESSSSIASQLRQSSSNGHFMQPSISEYNPSLPAFVRSPSLWPGWPSSVPVNPFVASPSVPNTAPSMPPVSPAHFLFPGALFSNETALANSFFGQALFDQSKLMEAYASPLIMKSFLEQNQLLNGNLNSAFLQHLITSFK